MFNRVVNREILLMTLLVAGMACCNMGSLGSWSAQAADPVKANWQLPATIEAPATGQLWTQCHVLIPSTWQTTEGLMAESITLTVEQVVDGAEVFVNERRLGVCGAAIDQRASARDEVHRWKIPVGTLHAGQYNAITLRLVTHEQRIGFNGRAPVLAGYHEECRLDGTWQIVSVEGNQRPDLRPLASAPRAGAFERFAPATSILQRPIELTPGRHLSPQDAQRSMEVADDLHGEVIIAEPDVAQPLSLDFDSRGRLWVVEYRQYPYPAGMMMVSRDKYYRATYDRLPLPPPHHTPGADRISIHSDTDHDGRWELRKVFLDRLNMVSSLELTPDGIWVLNPPYLLLYTDHNHDDIPDGDPEVHLEGFGLEDTHSVANSLTWCADGWLYGAQGSTTSSRIRVRGTDAPEVYRDGAMIWRYHPQQRRYEIFAEGGGNAFGIDIDARGHLFAGHNGGNTRGFYYLPGAYYQKGTDDKYGPLSNPYTFGSLPPMGHTESPRFSHDLIRYEGHQLPDRYRGQIISIDPLQQRLVLASIRPDGSTFATRDVEDIVRTRDFAFRPVDITTGPDGAVYVADFCEETIAHGQHYQGQLDPTTGRVYRFTARQAPPRDAITSDDLSQLDAQQLMPFLQHPNRWHRMKAIQELQRTATPEIESSLQSLLEDESIDSCLAALWILEYRQRLDDLLTTRLLHHRHADVRRWMIRLLGDRMTLSPRLARELSILAVQEHDAEVCAQLACTARRLNRADSWAIAQSLLQHDELAADPCLPLLLWWVIEARCDQPEPIIEWLSEAPSWSHAMVAQAIVERLMRRFASARHDDLLVCAKLLTLAPTADLRQKLLTALEASLQGSSMRNLPSELAAAIRSAGGGTVALQARVGDPLAIKQLITEFNDPSTPTSKRIATARILSELDDSLASEALNRAVLTETSPELLTAILHGLSTHADLSTSDAIMTRWSTWSPEVRAAAVRWMTTRISSAQRLLNAIDTQAIRADQIPHDTIAGFLWLRDDVITSRVATYWPDVLRDETIAGRAELQRVMQALQTGDADPYRGRQLFRETCAKCHTLFREGGDIGPNLTSYARHDIARLALHITQPSLEVREGFEAWIAELQDGRVAVGFLLEQHPDAVTLRTLEGSTQRLSRSAMESFDRSRQSLMPAALTEPWTPQQIRDLFAFLRLSQPLNER